MSDASGDRRTNGSGRQKTRRGRSVRVETSAGGVVVRRVGAALHFLLIRDPYGNWGLPKGHIEGGESPLEAALREVAEETGLAELYQLAELPTIDWYFRHRGRVIHKFCHFYLIESPSGDTCPQRTEGISACEWMPLEDAIEDITYDNARSVLRVAGQRLGLLRESAGS